MCDFNNLSADENGFILQCKSCRNYQIGFGSVLFSLNKTDYKKFCLMIADISEKDFNHERSNTRHIVIPTPYYGVNLLLCKFEILQLKDLINSAEQEEVTRSMLALFSNN